MKSLTKSSPLSREKRKKRCRLKGLKKAIGRIGGEILLAPAQKKYYVARNKKRGCAGIKLAFSTNTPAEHPKISPTELRTIQDNLAPRADSTSSPWAVVKEPQVLWLALSYLCLIYGLWMIVLWLPTYRDPK